MNNNEEFEPYKLGWNYADGPKPMPADIPVDAPVDVAQPQGPAIDPGILAKYAQIMNGQYGGTPQQNKPPMPRPATEQQGDLLDSPTFRKWAQVVPHRTAEDKKKLEDTRQRAWIDASLGDIANAYLGHPSDRMGELTKANLQYEQGLPEERAKEFGNVLSTYKTAQEAEVGNTQKKLARALATPGSFESQQEAAAATQRIAAVKNNLNLNASAFTDPADKAALLEQVKLLDSMEASLPGKSGYQIQEIMKQLPQIDSSTTATAGHIAQNNLAKAQMDTNARNTQSMIDMRKDESARGWNSARLAELRDEKNDLRNKLKELEDKKKEELQDDRESSKWREAAMKASRGRGSDAIGKANSVISGAEKLLPILEEAKANGGVIPTQVLQGLATMEIASMMKPTGAPTVNDIAHMNTENAATGFANVLGKVMSEPASVKQPKQLQLFIDIIKHAVDASKEQISKTFSDEISAHSDMFKTTKHRLLNAETHARVRGKKDLDMYRTAVDRIKDHNTSPEMRNIAIKALRVYNDKITDEDIQKLSETP